MIILRYIIINSEYFFYIPGDLGDSSDSWDLIRFLKSFCDPAPFGLVDVVFGILGSNDDVLLSSFPGTRCGL